MNITDRELLELAAKAAGIHGEYYSGFLNEEWVDGIVYVLDDGQQCIWNPLLDNGDALWLAVKLRLLVATNEETSWIGDPMFVEVQHDDAVNFDPYAATRRAIVHAAAEVGILGADKTGEKG